jgi:RNA polymerase sigma-70 factor (ECF subfamily)
VDEAGLLKDAKRGDEAAFLELYERYKAPVFRFAWRLTGSVETAEDVTQECFLNVLEGTRFDERRGALRTYLLGVARFLAMKRLRLAGRERPEVDTAAPHDPYGELLRAERTELVGRAVAALPVMQKEALILFEYEELSLEEVAQIVDADVGAVKARLARARESLRRKLAPRLERSY